MSLHINIILTEFSYDLWHTHTHTHHKVNSKYRTRQGNRNTQNSSGKTTHKSIDNGIKSDSLEFYC